MIIISVPKSKMYNKSMKAIDALTIDPANRLRKKVTVLQERYDKLDKVMARVKILEKEVLGVD